MEAIMNDIIHFMRQNLNNGISVQDLADHFNYSYPYFCREFKRIQGIGAHEFIVALRFESARNDLIHRGISITHAYIRAGYSSFGTFSSQFKRYTGSSPRSLQINAKSDVAFIKDNSNPSTIYTDDNTIDKHHPLNVSIHNCTQKRSLILVGLFHRPIPNHRPIRGMALINRSTTSFIQVPSGQYYLMALCVELSQLPHEFFSFKHSKRALHDHLIHFPLTQSSDINLYLRPALIGDPPILYNFAKLFRESFTKKKNKD